VDAWSPEWWWLAYLTLGLVVGLLAGLLGIGGGVVIVPLLVFLFTAHHFPEDRIVHLALGTSLTSIVFTNLSSVRAHHLRGAVRWDILRAIAPGVIAGTLLGPFFADRLSSRYLAIIFTVFVFFSSIQMLLDRKPKLSRQLPGKAGMSVAGFAIGGLSSLVGVGGGILTIPLMTMSEVPMINCIATSAAIGLPISLAGAVGYVIAGLDKTHLPPLSLGYVYIPALAGLVLGSFVTVPMGARMAHGMPAQLLKRIFVVIMLVLAAKMLYSLV
jgi:uncharacterized membrane protein YfcA